MGQDPACRAEVRGPVCGERESACPLDAEELLLFGDFVSVFACQPSINPHYIMRPSTIFIMARSKAEKAGAKSRFSCKQLRTLVVKWVFYDVATSVRFSGAILQRLKSVNQNQSVASSGAL